VRNLPIQQKLHAKFIFKCFFPALKMWLWRPCHGGTDIFIEQKIPLQRNLLCIFFLFIHQPSWDRSVSIGTAYGLDGWGSISGRGKRFFSTPQHTDRLWGPPKLLSNGYLGRFPQRWSGLGMKLTTHLHLVPRSIMTDLHLHSAIHLHGVVITRV
jgi:hypothetical protein